MDVLGRDFMRPSPGQSRGTLSAASVGVAARPYALVAAPRARPFRVSDAVVYAVDANAYFARPGPRVVEGVELLAHLFHPDLVPWSHAERPWERIDAD